MIRYIRRYMGFTRCAVSRKLAYRAGLYTSILSASISLIVSLFLWSVLFRGQSVIGGYGFREMITYLAVVFVCNATLGNTTERNISNRVLDGSIASDLIKPLKFLDMCLFEAMGGAFVDFLVAALSGAVIILLVGGGLPGGAGLVSALLFAVSFIMAFSLKFYISFIAGLTCFYTSNGYGVLYLRQTITDIFSGAMLPLTFYPVWFQGVAGVLPFQAAVYTPVQIFLGRLTGIDALWALVFQFFWIIATMLFGTFFFTRAVRKITVHGG